ncbi:MAG: hypothetical protein EXQ56_12110 [Acidobacteria bacterium]|nr:hypothetical protein [Acidobacteriota bacterium]
MRIRLATLILLANIFLASGLDAKWVAIGPYGGDARALAADPRDPDRMYAGTRTGQVYLTVDAGRTWTPLGGLQLPPYWVVDQLLVDPNNNQVVYAGVWSLRDKDGGVWKSEDRGRTWKALEGMKEQSVRALALAPSDSRTLVAGTLEGVFRSRDAGANWERISPLNHDEIHSVESVAIDPRDANIVYAGTWHLAWKSSDGGQRWVSIKKGMLDDSDVFSITIDPKNPDTVYATACSGIYRSDTAGTLWKRIQGIPSTSRRTHTLVIEPRNTNIVYAGTTEGLWRTEDRGETWKRLTAHTWSINAIVLDPTLNTTDDGSAAISDAGRFFIAMDHGGVMETLDGGARFRGANWGFAQRQVSRLVTDPAAPADKPVLYASVLHDGDFGGVFMTNNRGASWQQLSAGLKGHDVLSLLIVTKPSWKLLAGTPDGVFEYSPDKPIWQQRGKWQVPARTGGASSSAQPNSQPPITVRDLYQRSPEEPILAATSHGLFESADGETWRPLLLDGDTNGGSGGGSEGGSGHYAITATVNGSAGNQLVAASALGLSISRDRGRNWSAVRLNGGQPVRIHNLAASPNDPQQLLAATEAGLLRSNDGGATWNSDGRGLPGGAVADISFDPANPRQVLLAGAAGAFYSLDGGEWYSRLGPPAATDYGSFDLNSVLVLANSQALAVSVNNGLFIQDGRDGFLPPQTSASK